MLRRSGRSGRCCLDAMNQTVSIPDAAMARQWFYPYRLPDGRTVPSTHAHKLDAIHHTRSALLARALRRHFPQGVAGLRALDLACHQGWFSVQLARYGFAEVVGVDARPEHVADTALIAQALELPQIRTVQSDVHAVTGLGLGEFDVVLNFGLIYHLENPVGALRVTRAMCRGMAAVETQVVPHLSGNVDWGHHTFVKPLMGCFGIIDETEETHGPEMSTTGICLAPSTPALIWILEKCGFRDVAVVPPDEDAYEQHRYGKRVVVAGRV